MGTDDGTSDWFVMANGVEELQYLPLLSKIG